MDCWLGALTQQSQLGTVLDPIADKLMLVTAFIVLSMRSVFPQPLPEPPARAFLGDRCALSAATSSLLLARRQSI